MARLGLVGGACAARSLHGERQGNRLRGDVLGDVLENIDIKRLAHVIAGQVFDPRVHN